MHENTVTHKGPEIEKALDLVKWIQENIRLARWKPQLHRKRFVERTAGEVLRRRTVNYMNPCLDLTTALATIKGKRIQTYICSSGINFRTYTKTCISLCIRSKSR